MNENGTYLLLLSYYRGDCLMFPISFEPEIQEKVDVVVGFFVFLRVLSTSGEVAGDASTVEPGSWFLGSRASRLRLR